MGYPIRSNIFRIGSDEQKQFARFPIQVAVLYSPRDKVFVDSFREAFLELDRLTGEYVVFFAVLDPPPDWLNQNREWWKRYSQQLGPVGFSANDRPLMEEIGQLFGVDWEDLPVLVVSTNLWGGEFIVVATTPDQLTRQFLSLTKFAREHSSDVDIGDLVNLFEITFGQVVHYHPPDDNLRYGLLRLYDTLETDKDFDENRRSEKYATSLVTTVSLVAGSINRVRRQMGIGENGDRAQHYESTPIPFGFVESVLRGLAGRLVPFAAVANRVVGRLRRESPRYSDGEIAAPARDRLRQNGELVNSLDDTSYTMIERAILVGSFLESFREGRIEPLLANRAIDGALRRSFEEEFAPAAQGVWKAFEREINLSIVRAMRCARSIEMPDYFALYKQDLRPPELGVVNTRKRRVKINEQDWTDPARRRHRFLEIGTAWHATLALTGNSDEDFDRVLRRCLGGSLPSGLIHDWQQIADIRNPASHTELLSRDGYRMVFEKGLDPDNLYPLVRIKRELSRPRV